MIRITKERFWEAPNEGLRWEITRNLSAERDKDMSRRTKNLLNVF